MSKFDVGFRFKTLDVELDWMNKSMILDKQR